MLIAICHRCPHRQRPCKGPCACTIDGVDIIEHAKSGECPNGRFDGILPDKPDPRARLTAEAVPDGHTRIHGKMFRLERHGDLNRYGLVPVEVPDDE